ncbi:MAG: MmgE/PrpD family protein [Nocardioidaceae bacterium]
MLSDLLERANLAQVRGDRSRQTEQVLLADFLAVVSGAGATAGPRGWANDGTAGAAAALADRAHAADREDIHWPTSVHPGAIVWPVVLALGSEAGASGDRTAEAARIGYQCMIDFASLLGPVHARTWHATATSGVLGAAVAAGTVLQLSSQQLRWACGHAVSVAGGVGQAVIERSGTTRFHRVAAAVVGIQAARQAAAGVTSSTAVLEGQRGVLINLAPGARVPAPPAGGAALDDTSVRLFPVNGFAQSAVALTAELRRTSPGVALGLAVEVSGDTADATTGLVGGTWWDLRAAVAAAWINGDPFDLEPTADSDALRKVTRVIPAPLPNGAANVTVTTDRGTVNSQIEAPFGRSVLDPTVRPLLKRKWQQLWNRPSGGDEVWRWASEVLARGPRPDDLSLLLDRPPSATGAR